MSPSTTTVPSSPRSTPSEADDNFASVWESTIVPLLLNLLGKHCGPQSDFSVDVHSFSGSLSREDPGQEAQSGSSRRVIYIALSPTAAHTVSSLGDNSGLENTIKRELERAVPARFGSLHLKFRTMGCA